MPTWFTWAGAAPEAAAGPLPEADDPRGPRAAGHAQWSQPSLHVRRKPPAPDCRSRRGTQRGDILVFIPGALVINEACVSPPLVGPNIRNAGACTRDGATAAVADGRECDTYGWAGSGAFNLL